MIRTKKFWYAWVATTLVMVIYNYSVRSTARIFSQDFLSPYFQTVERQYELVWSVLIAMIASFIFLWFYHLVGRGMKLWRFGLSCGIFMSFQILVGNELFVVGYPYPLGWPWVFGFVGLYLVAGLAAEAVYGKITE